MLAHEELEFIRYKILLHNKPVEKVCEFKDLGTFVSQNFEKDPEGRRQTFMHIYRTLDRCFDKIMHVTKYLKLY